MTLIKSAMMVRIHLSRPRKLIGGMSVIGNTSAFEAEILGSNPDTAAKKMHEWQKENA